MKNEVWAVAVVRDEADIIEYTLRHLVAQGIDGIAIQDNNSQDNTVDIIRRFQIFSPVPVLVFRDKNENDGYFQSERMTELSNIAHDHGARFIVPFDADELWYSESGPLADTIIKSNLGAQYAQQKFYFCSGADNKNEPNPYKRIQYREDYWAPWTKVCFQWFSGVVVGSGNHALFDGGGRGVSQTGDYGIRIAHFPCRSFDQFVSKIARHGLGYDRQYPNDPYWNGDAPVQRQLYRMFQSAGTVALLNIWNDVSFKRLGFSYFKDPIKSGLVLDPAPYTE